MFNILFMIVFFIFYFEIKFFFNKILKRSLAIFVSAKHTSIFSSSLVDLRSLVPCNMIDSLFYVIISWRARHCSWEKNVRKKMFEFILAYNTPRSSCLAGYTQHIYTNVLFYYIDISSCSIDDRLLRTDGHRFSAL